MLKILFLFPKCSLSYSKLVQNFEVTKEKSIYFQEKRRNNIHCSSIYEILNIDNFNNYLKNEQIEININDIINLLFDDNNNNNIIINQQNDPMTETCYDINKVITKEIF